MKKLFPLLALVLMALPAQAQVVDNGQVTVRLNLVGPQTTCSITKISDLDFGNYYIPASGTAMVTYQATDGQIILNDPTLDAGGSPVLGEIEVSGTNASGFFVQTNVNAPAGTSLLLNWARDGGSGFVNISGSRYPASGDAPVSGSFTERFRFGGELSFGSSMTSGLHSGSYDITASCSQ